VLREQAVEEEDEDEEVLLPAIREEDEFEAAQIDDAFANSTPNPDHLVTVQGRELISLEAEPSVLVVREHHQDDERKPITISYTAFDSVKPSLLILPRRKGVVAPRARPAAPDPARNHQLLSRSATFAFEHLSIDLYTYNEELTSADHGSMYRLAKSKAWSSWDAVSQH
jgi:hypothetical protein